MKARTLALCPAPINRKDGLTAVIVRLIRFLADPMSEDVVVKIMGKGGQVPTSRSRIARSVYAGEDAYAAQIGTLPYLAHGIGDEGMAVSG